MGAAHTGEDPLSEERVDAALALVKAEIIRAARKFGPMRSPHEGYGVLKEEVDELWDDIKANRLQPSLVEAIQVAAMGVKYVLSLEPTLPVPLARMVDNQIQKMREERTRTRRSVSGHDIPSVP